MKRCILFSCLVGLLTMVSCTRATRDSSQDEVGLGFSKGELLVTAKKLNALKEEHSDLEVTEVYPEIDLYLLKSKDFAAKETFLSQDWVQRGLVEAAEPNYIQHVSRVTNDPYYLDLWGLKNNGQDAPNGTEGKENADIGVEKVWEKTTGSRSVVVAVMDTGIDYTHPDLSANIYKNEKEDQGRDANGKLNNIDDDGNGYVDDVYGWNFVSVTQETLSHGQEGNPDVMDLHGHGTHVAGTIGAVGGNAVGIVGVNQQVRMMALRVLDAQGSGETSDIIRAIRYAALMKVDVVNASFGGGGKSAQFYKALKKAGENGVLFVAAAGNESNNNDEQLSYPSSYDLDNVLSVAATDNRDQIADFSNYGYVTVDLSAPGVNIKSTYPTKLAAQEGTPDDPYRVFSGTSMATPHTVGAAALLVAAVPALQHKPYEIKKRLMESVDWLPQLAGRVRSGGRLNVARAVAGEVTNPLGAEEWVEQAYSLKSPMNPVDHIDQVYVVKPEGDIKAKAIRAHITDSLIDSVDVAALYDGSMRIISFLPSDASDYWTPVVVGDSMVMRFANALVSMQTVKDRRVVADPEADPELVGKPNVTCFPSLSIQGKFECITMNDPTTPKGNHRSEGFVVDKIAYVK